MGMIVNILPVGQGVAVYGPVDDPEQQVERPVIGTAITDIGEPVPLCWDAKTGRYWDARELEGFLGLDFEPDDDDDEEADELDETDSELS